MEPPADSPETAQEPESAPTSEEPAAETFTPRIPGSGEQTQGKDRTQTFSILSESASERGLIVSDWRLSLGQLFNFVVPTSKAVNLLGRARRRRSISPPAHRPTGCGGNESLKEARLFFSTTAVPVSIRTGKGETGAVRQSMN